MFSFQVEIILLQLLAFRLLKGLSYIFAPLVGLVRPTVLSHLEDERPSIALGHSDVKAPVGSHHRSVHQREAAEIF